MVPPRLIDVALIVPVEPLIVTPEPTLMVFVAPLSVMLAEPTVRIQVTLASPTTVSFSIGFVVPMPTLESVWIPDDVFVQ